jgi:hypothetical protein
LTNLKAPALSITESHAGGFTQGQSGATYAITVGNAVGAGPSSGAGALPGIARCCPSARRPRCWMPGPATRRSQSR